MLVFFAAVKLNPVKLCQASFRMLEPDGKLFRAAAASPYLFGRVLSLRRASTAGPPTSKFPSEGSNESSLAGSPTSKSGVLANEGNRDGAVRSRCFRGWGGEDRLIDKLILNPVGSNRIARCEADRESRDKSLGNRCEFGNHLAGKLRRPVGSWLFWKLVGSLMELPATPRITARSSSGPALRQGSSKCDAVVVSNCKLTRARRAEQAIDRFAGRIGTKYVSSPWSVTALLRMAK